MAEKTNLGTLADEVAAGVGEACRVIDALRAENAGLKTGLATLQDGIASALGWDCKGVPFTDLIRRLKADNARLLEACRDLRDRHAIQYGMARPEQLPKWLTEADALIAEAEKEGA